MEQRVDVREWVEFQWPYLMSFLGGSENVSKLAYETGAFVRPRKIDNPEDLLRLLLLRCAGGRSLQDTAAIAAESGLADVSDAALLKRFAKATEWLGALVGEVLTERPASVAAGWRIRLVDATTVSRAGSKETDHRVHLSINLARNRIDAFELTSAKGGETLDRFVVRPGEIMIADAGYAHREALARVARQGGSFIIRFAWSNLPLETVEGEPFDLMQALEGLPEAKAGDFPVTFRASDGQVIAARVVAIRKSEQAASAARKRLLQERSKKGRKVDLRTLQFASYIFVLTNLPADLSAESVLELYRFRWQIEMKFKTLKSLLHLDNLPVRTDAALKVYVLAKMLVALLIDALIEKAESFSPWGYPIPAGQCLAPHPTPA
jgi:uncharacterized protein YegP (UPF0339 family)